MLTFEVCLSLFKRWITSVLQTEGGRRHHKVKKKKSTTAAVGCLMSDNCLDAQAVNTQHVFSEINTGEGEKKI